MKKIAIVGGGAAGLCLAVMLRQRCNTSVTVFEAATRVGRKLAATGNGRCNISNKNISLENYHGEAEFAYRLIERFPPLKQEEFFHRMGIVFTQLEDGKLYPRSLQATSVVDALRFQAEGLGVNIAVDSRVTDIVRNENGFSLKINHRFESVDAVCIATGGESGGRLGSTDGYAMLKAFGHKIEKIFPAIVQVKTTTEVVRQLKGIKVMANVTAESGSEKRTEYGEVLFCDYGLSGPPVLQVSRILKGENATIKIDLVPDMSHDILLSELKSRIDTFKDRPASELFTGFLHNRLGQVVLKSSGVNINLPCSDIDDTRVDGIVSTLKSFCFKSIGTTGLENAQVTAGGAQAAQFFDNCMSKKIKGLFAIGEVLNVDGDCGGYNLAFAWASANAAADGIKEFIEK